MAWRSGLRDWVKTVKAKTIFRVKKHRKYTECPHQSVCDYSEWHLHFQASTVLFALAFVVDLQSDQAIYFRGASEEII